MQQQRDDAARRAARAVRRCRQSHIEVAAMMEFQAEAATTDIANHLGGQSVENQLASYFGFLRRINQCNPETALIGEALEQQYFNLATGFLKPCNRAGNTWVSLRTIKSPGSRKLPNSEKNVWMSSPLCRRSQAGESLPDCRWEMPQ